jgi:peptide chain release factor subunit 3
LHLLLEIRNLIMNPNASEWKPSAAAPEWTPSTSVTPASAAAPPSQSESNVSEIDESDPLWKVVLKIAEGDRDKATKMIADPDSLVEYPEVMAILEAGDDNESESIYTSEAVDNDLSKEVKDQVTISKPNLVEKKEEEEEEEEEVEEEDAVEGDPREHFNLVFIGHVDAGKSTLSGNILYLTDNVDKRTIERYEREAKERNRESWFLAYIMDTDEKEREKGKTVEVGRAQFNTEAKRYTIMDAPGHKNYVPNMIMGASQADIAVLVISARKGEFETGFDRGGQTREHALLAKTLGVSHLVVVVNKMDDTSVNWSKARYDECINKLRPFLKGCGFTIKREVTFIPISGLTGANVIKEVEPSECSWWKPSYESGENNTSIPTLIGLLDSLQITGRDAAGPIRIPVLDRYNDRGTIAMGKVESGTIKPGMKVMLMPTRNICKVDGIWDAETPLKSAKPGENILVKLNGMGLEDVQRGFVICSKDNPCRAVNKVICQIALMDMPENTKIFTAGFTSIFHAHTSEEECTVTKIFETTNSKRVVNKKAVFASVGMQVICMLELERSVPLETFDDFPFLGRFTLRTEGKTIAIGKVLKLPPKKED